MSAAVLSLSLPLAVHVPDGMLRAPWLVGGFLVAGLLALLASYKVRDEEIPRIALLSAAFFVATLMHIPMGPASVHLLLNGLVGVVLGRRAPLAILIGLALQAALFGHGGLTTIGVNACVQIFPALLSAWLFFLLCRGARIQPHNRTALWLLGCFIGVVSVLAALLLEAVVLVAGGVQDWLLVVQVMFLAHLPVAAIEGVVLGFTVSFLARVKPDMLGLRRVEQNAETNAPLPLAPSSSLREVPSPVHPPALLLAVVALTALATPAQAHRLDADCKILPGRQIRIESWFDIGGDPPKGAEVTVLRPDQSVLAKGQLDSEGCFTFHYSEAEQLEVTIAAPDGHRKTFTIDRDRLDPSEPARSIPVIDREAMWRERLKEALIGISFLFSLAAFLLSWRNGRRLRSLQQNAEAISEPELQKE